MHATLILLAAAAALGQVDPFEGPNPLILYPVNRTVPHLRAPAPPTTRDYGATGGKRAYRDNVYSTETPEGRRFVEQSRAHEAGRAPAVRLTIIGPRESRDPVLADLETSPNLADVKGRVAVQDYDPGEWAIDPALGFPRGGKPDLILQVGSRVVWRSRDYSCGPQGLAEAIRQADPGYDPAADPGPANNALLGGLDAILAGYPLALVLVPVALVLFLPRRK